MKTNLDPYESQLGFQGRLGIARVDITPPVGIYARNWGAAKQDVVESIHRPLTLTALTLAPTESDVQQVLIDADLGWWRSAAAFAMFQRQLLEAIPLPPEQVLFALSHTHAGPPLMEPDRSLPGGELLEQWRATLLEKTVEAVRSAQATQFKGQIEWTRGRCDLAAVRDLPDPENNSQRILCGFNPRSVADNTLIIGRISDVSLQTRAVLVNYACHPTTLAWENTAISPDYVGAMRATIEEQVAAPAMFLLGACGDLAPRYQYVGDTSVADEHGRQLGFAALSALHGMLPVGTYLQYSETVESGAPLAVWKPVARQLSAHLLAVQRIADVPLKDWPSANELERQRQACTDRALQERLRRKRDIRRGIGDGKTYPLAIYAWRLGDAVLVGCCCEPYSLLQQELRRRFSKNIIICVNLLNGSLGYLPPAEAYETDVYPVWQTPFDRGSFETVLETMTRAIHDVLSS